MIHFECDYACGAHPAVLKALVETNEEQHCGYSEDDRCAAAAGLIRELCHCPDAAVHFVVGGTQANLLVIDAGLRPFEGVLCADTGHINVHETGAVEATGHKVLPLPSTDGKISAAQVEAAVLAQRNDSSHEHIVRPAMVYISHPTEIGTLYTRDELTALSETCHRLGLTLFVDGARLGYGLAADETVDLPFLAGVCDAFTIGGTKVGLLFGEAIVITGEAYRDFFRYRIKQRGAMLAKGRLLGVQFEALLKDNLYVEASRKANRQAQQIKQAFVEKGFPLFCDTVANQIFIVLPNEAVRALEEQYVITVWGKVDEQHTAVRLVTSVCTRDEDVEALLARIATL
ncbi:MAG: aminotransferase class I/II-fold pyridoxal phosphate-dependent enzyme [Clostridia bacterium]|nr:aminotransferase class I/II-fold pyridoxal phosphate-dependent enzyme [Clostridia bacterium]